MIWKIILILLILSLIIMWIFLPSILWNNINSYLLWLIILIIASVLLAIEVVKYI